MAQRSNSAEAIDFYQAQPREGELVEGGDFSGFFLGGEARRQTHGNIERQSTIHNCGI